MKLPTSFSKRTTLSIFLIFTFIFIFSCGGEDSPSEPPGPEPIPNVNHIIKLQGNAGEGAIATLFKNGQIDGNKTDKDGNTEVHDINKLPIATYDSITLEKEGFTRWVKENISVGPITTYTYSITKLTEKKANAIIKLVDQNNNTIENPIFNYNGTDMAVDSTLVLKDVPVGEMNVTVKLSDSTFQMFTPYVAKINLVEGDNVITEKKDAPLKEFYARFGIVVDDQNDTKVADAKVSVANRSGLTDAQGGLVIDNIELSANPLKRWLSVPKSTTYEIDKEGYADYPPQEITLKEGVNNYAAQLYKLPVTAAQAGNIKFAGQLRNDFVTDVEMVLMNNQVNDSIYQVFTNDVYVGEFRNVFVPDSNNPAAYTLTIKDTRSDGIFLETTKQVSVKQGDNTNLAVLLDLIPNEIDITAVIRDNETLAKVSGQTVHLVQDNTDQIIATQVTNSNGEAVFDDIPGGASYHVVNEGSGTYKKTNGTFSTNNVFKMSDTQSTINTTAIANLYTKEGDYIPGDIVEIFRPREYNTEFLLGHLRMYFPELSGGNQIYKDQASEFAELLGFPNAIIAYDTPFNDPTQSQIEGYNPYPQNREVYTGQIGTNIDSYSGTSTGTAGKILPNGNEIIFYVDGLNLGGLDESSNHHEFGNLIGAPLIPGTIATMKTSRNTNAATSTTLQEATYDIPVMKAWLFSGKHHYDSTDSQGRAIEYNTTTKIE
jgi:hypothetical protein